ncbi:hypothetical protein [Arenicella xantha]|uniref:Nucleoside phosphorylase n=1 Tax=Arenicella xantha TaxID=644221 RepID=A0A395JFZ6_9GAMM|nr:hypothetical protein [Arenicella xantha]RBP48277.1 hypothetical protein DFR28_1086 [Arenicella xantha]
MPVTQPPSSTLPLITLIAALSCEVRPWIDAHRLKKTIAKPFDCYRSESLEIIVAGIGAEAMATAVGWAGGQSDRSRVWLNIGTAGHASRAVGEVFLVHGCAAGEQGRAHYPPLIAKWSGASDAVLSVPAPSSDYPIGAAVDMEAAAFYSAAMRFAPSELVQSIKVVSDNQSEGIEHLNASRITELMTPHVACVDRFSEQLRDVAMQSMVATPAQCFTDIRATVSQRRQIEQLVNQISYMSDTDVLHDLSQKTSLTAKALLRELNAIAADIVPQLAALSLEGTKHG